MAGRAHGHQIKQRLMKHMVIGQVVNLGGPAATPFEPGLAVMIVTLEHGFPPNLSALGLQIGVVLSPPLGVLFGLHSSSFG